MTVGELIEMLKGCDPAIPVIAPNWHEEYGLVEPVGVKVFDDEGGFAKDGKVLSIVGSL